ncbi:Methyltransferase-like protein 22 [Bulinus truncatus]|nr:Methyltransferase-like protein 22 [Bulinus truncatus]
MYFSRFHFHLPKSVIYKSALSNDAENTDDTLDEASSKSTNFFYSSSSLKALAEQEECDEDGDPVLVRKNSFSGSHYFNTEIKCNCEVSDFLSDTTCEEYDSKLNNHKSKEINPVRLSSLIDDTCQVITLEHKMETSLSDVGYQVWSGALLMCDYLLNIHSELNRAHVVDLGSGTGITSVVAAMFADCVVCTDYSSDLLKVAERNWKRNKDLLYPQICTQTYFKILDWTNDYPPVAQGNENDAFRLNHEDLHLIEKANIYLSAEAIYDEELTQAFFKTAYYLLSKSPPKCLYVALEKRIIFSSEHQQICSPAYEAFQEHLEDLISVDDGPVRFKVEKISVDFPRCFHYTRTKYLELWKISSEVSETDRRMISVEPIQDH